MVPVCQSPYRSSGNDFLIGTNTANVCVTVNSKLGLRSAKSALAMATYGHGHSGHSCGAATQLPNLAFEAHLEFGNVSAMFGSQLVEFGSYDDQLA